MKYSMPWYHYERNKRKAFVVDLVEENVRNRCIFPLFALALFIGLTLTQYVPAIPTDIKPEKFYFTMPLYNEYNISSDFSHAFPEIRTKAYSSKGLVNIHPVKIMVVDL